MNFSNYFKVITGYAPMRWQQRLFENHFDAGELPSAVSIPTGLGKTTVMAVWLLALARSMKDQGESGGKPPLPRRLVYVVDRRAVVDQATRFAETLRENLGKPEAQAIAQALGLAGTNLPISTLRGQFVDNREWLEDPAKPAIIVGTVDMIGSRLLFEGYGVSRKMRPYHAGLMGADALVLLDEAHLVPPFEALLSSIANGAAYGARSEEDSQLIPAFKLLPLSATWRGQTAQPFSLEEKDFLDTDGKTVTDVVTHERLHARKRLKLQQHGNRKSEDGLAAEAWKLAHGTDSGHSDVQGEIFESGLLAESPQNDEGTLRSVRIIVYCYSRDVAEKVKIELDKKAKKTAAEGRIELFVGARRVRERIEAEKRLKDLGFLAGEDRQQTKPAFLVATSAGEVGVDLDADHMVCDLVAWERMVQRFGRVNRRGKGNARITVVDTGEPVQKNAEKPTVQETENIRIYGALKRVLEGLDSNDEGCDVSPNALRILAARDDLRATLLAATTPAPLRPALNRALVDAWSMTSLPEHTGRPEVAPWVRGWVDEDPQTTVAWRKYLPVSKGAETSKKQIEDFFEAAPLHVSETLDTESRRVFEWLKKRAAGLVKTMNEEEGLKRGDVAAMLLKTDGSLFRSLKLDDLLGDTKDKDDKKRLEEIERDIKGKTLVLDMRFGGLQDGLLNPDSNDAQPTADDGSEWLVPIDGKPIIRFRILERVEEDEGRADDGWRENLRFDLERSMDGEVSRWLVVQKWRDTSNNENDRAAGRTQALREHQSWVEMRIKDIATRLGLPDVYVHVLAIAARLHDEGKKGRNWKRAFHVERYAREIGTPGDALAKTPKFNWRLLENYRHEFGSLPYAKGDAEFKALSSEMQDLVLHLIAAHHGYARPLIAIEGCEDAPPSALEKRACEVALRYARLQKRWGPWGLAWWEALLRAADVQASRANDERNN